MSPSQISGHTVELEETQSGGSKLIRRRESLLHAATRTKNIELISSLLPFFLRDEDAYDIEMDGEGKEVSEEINQTVNNNTLRMYFFRTCNAAGLSGSFLSPSNQHDINSLNWGGDSALAIAISQSDFPTVQMFLNSGANIKQPGLLLIILGLITL